MTACVVMYLYVIVYLSFLNIVNFTKTTANQDNELTTTEPAVHCYGEGMCV